MKTTKFIKPTVRKEEEKKKGGFGLLSWLRALLGGAGGQGGIGSLISGLLATKAGAIGLAAAGMALVAGLGILSTQMRGSKPAGHQELSSEFFKDNGGGDSDQAQDNLPHADKSGIDMMKQAASNDMYSYSGQVKKPDAAPAETAAPAKEEPKAEKKQGPVAGGVPNVADMMKQAQAAAGAPGQGHASFQPKAFQSGGGLSGGIGGSFGGGGGGGGGGGAFGGSNLQQQMAQAQGSKDAALQSHLHAGQPKAINRAGNATKQLAMASKLSQAAKFGGGENSHFQAGEVFDGSKGQGPSGISDGGVGLGGGGVGSGDNSSPAQELQQGGATPPTPSTPQDTEPPWADAMKRATIAFLAAMGCVMIGGMLLKAVKGSNSTGAQVLRALVVIMALGAIAASAVVLEAAGELFGYGQYIPGALFSFMGLMTLISGFKLMKQVADDSKEAKDLDDAKQKATADTLKHADQGVGSGKQIAVDASDPSKRIDVSTSEDTVKADGTKVHYDVSSTGNGPGGGGQGWMAKGSDGSTMYSNDGQSWYKGTGADGTGNPLSTNANGQLSPGAGAVKVTDGVPNLSDNKMTYWQDGKPLTDAQVADKVAWKVDPDSCKQVPMVNGQQAYKVGDGWTTDPNATKADPNIKPGDVTNKLYGDNGYGTQTSASTVWKVGDNGMPAYNYSGVNGNFSSGATWQPTAAPAPGSPGSGQYPNNLPSTPGSGPSAPAVGTAANPATIPSDATPPANSGETVTNPQMQQFLQQAQGQGGGGVATNNGSYHKNSSGQWVRD